MSMEYISPLLHNKRHREENHHEEECHCQPKRVCNGLKNCVQVEYSALTASPMDTWEVQQVSPHVSTKVLPAQSAPQCCPRCMAGEPGHINHIMQRY